MKKPLQATLTTPPLVEYVAVGRESAGLAERVVAGVPDVVGGEDGAMVTPGCGDSEGPAAGTVVEVPAFGAVLVGAVSAADEPDSRSLTTSLAGEDHRRTIGDVGVRPWPSTPR